MFAPRYGYRTSAPRFQQPFRPFYRFNQPRVVVQPIAVPSTRPAPARRVVIQTPQKQADASVKGAKQSKQPQKSGVSKRDQVLTTLVQSMNYADNHPLHSKSTKDAKIFLTKLSKAIATGHGQVAEGVLTVSMGDVDAQS